MKRSTLIFALSILGLGVAMSFALSPDHTKGDTLRVAFPYSKPAEAYEPARITLAPEYIFLENIYSPLVEMSTKGEVSPGLAQSYHWAGNELHLVMRDNLKTVSGRSITAADAEFSLKRLLSLPGNTHGEFQQLICGNPNLQSISGSCDGISVRGNELILKTTDAGKTFLLPMLTAIDFAIIPKSSVDINTSKIVDFKETSGPYYVSKNSATGEIELSANPNHYHYSSSIPQKIRLVPTSSQDSQGSLHDFASGKVDFITTVDAARADDVIEFSRTQNDSVLHTSMNIRSFVLTFTERGMAELSRDERLAIGQKIRQEIVKRFAGVNGYEASRQFFPTFGEGALDKDRMAPIDKAFDEAAHIPSKPLMMTLIRLGDSEKFVDAVKAALPQIETKVASESASFSHFKALSDMPHMMIVGPDTGFLEDIGLISYSMNAGYFGLKKTDRAPWLKNYMAIPEKDRRMALLRDLHEASLSQPIIVPLLVAPYAALARKPWKIGLSQLYANNQLWLIQSN